jgi:hypothetical protein
MTKHVARLAPAMLVAALVLLASAPALAHEEREVGKLTMAVGFGQEPAYAGEPNSAQMILDDAGKPVTDLGEGLSVMVTFGSGGDELPLSFEPNFEVGEWGTPGDYRAWFIPTRPGSYTFHITGSVHGQDVDEVFTSGPKTFSDVISASEVEFPVADPTTGELSEKMDRELARSSDAVAAATASAKAAADDASTARSLAIAGLLVGALGLIAGVTAFVVARRRA